MENGAASVRARLLAKAKAEGVPFDEILRRYGIERLLYRLAQSKFNDRFILKGAQLLRIWSAEAFRPTMDMDLLGRITNDLEEIKDVVQQLCNIEIEPEDGLVFTKDPVQVERIKEDADYHGVRVTLAAYLAAARIPIQIDIGFNDVILPAPQAITFPTLLDLPSPQLLGYTAETVFAEKFEAMVKLGEANSRMKDFYDLRFLIRQGLLPNQASLLQSIRATFTQRGTALPTQLPVLLAQDHPVLPQKQIQWSAFVRKKRLKDTPAHFTEVTQELSVTIQPLIQALQSDNG